MASSSESSSGSEHVALAIGRTWTANDTMLMLHSSPNKSFTSVPTTKILSIYTAPMRVKSGDTLSHCWGGRTPIMITMANYQRHTNNIPLPPLKTSIDAVLVVRALGVQYLWIDSLCIIQGSSRDWSEQAPQMASTYGNAYCTISADAAENSSDGFVEGSRRVVGHTPHIMKFTHQGQEGAVHVRAHKDTMPEQPLHDLDTLAFCQRGNRGCSQVDNTTTGAPYCKLSRTHECSRRVCCFVGHCILGV